MDRQEWKQIEEIVDTALTLDESEREDYIQEACGENAELETRVRELLENIEKAEENNYLEDPGKYEEFHADFSSSEKEEEDHYLVGKQIDRYEVLELIDHGGMASVYLAERADKAYEAKVAFKVMRRGMDTPSNIARFKRERNILAQLDHTNIARLLDGGVTEEGLPYLVMEYVEGTPLLAYCDENRLSVKRRLGLFKSICRAVQYAHKNAVIHRDLKPSNILVNSDGQVKILDFGIAKMLETPEPGSARFQTREGARILTPAYAAPEQLEDEAVTTAADLYTLGVLLNEMLVGVHPFDFEGKQMTEVEHIIRNESPVKPSARLKSLPAEKKKEIAHNRSTTFDSLLKTIQGDLDAIVEKALRKEPEDRYTTADQFQDDLERRERNEPVVAREDTLQYKGKKFLHRHKKGIMTTAAMMLVIAGIIGYYTTRLSQERDEARLEAEKAEQVTAFLTDLIETNYPENAQGDTITIRQFLDQGYNKVQKLNKSPAVQANIMQVMAHTYQSLGEIDKADSLISQVINMQDTVNIKKVERAKSYDLYGLILRDQGEVKKAEEVMEKAMKLYQEIGKTETGDFAKLLRDLAYIKRLNGNYERALSIARRAINIEKRIYGKHNINSAETYYVLASILRHQDNYEEAKKNQLTSLRIVKSEIKGPHPGKLTNYNNLAIIYDNQDSLHKATTYYLKSLSMSKKLYGEKHHNIATTYGNLSGVMMDRGKLDSAEVLIKKAIAMRKEISGYNHPSMAEDISDYANICRKKKEYEKADSLYNRALEIMQHNFEQDHPQLVRYMHEKAVNAYRMGQKKTAERLLREVLQIRKTRHEVTDEKIQKPLDQLLKILKEENRVVEADSLRKRFI